MNVIQWMTLSLFLVGKSSSEVQQTFYKILEGSTTCTIVELNCNTMVSDFSYPEIHLVGNGKRLMEWVAKTHKFWVPA